MKLTYCAIVLVALGAELGAQPVLGAGEDATMAPRGSLRVRLTTQWTRASERFRGPEAGFPRGTLVPLGAGLSFDTIGVAQFENLAAIQAGVRTLAAMPAFTASLGRSVARVREHVLATPVRLEFGALERATVSVTIPFLTAKSEVDFRMNPTGREPTLGFNPTFTAAAAIDANGALLTQFDNAASQLTQRLAACATDPAGAGCASLNANRTAAQRLITDADAFSAALADLYGGRNGATGRLFVPIAGTAAHAAIEARIAAFKALYTGFGAGAIAAAGPLAAQAPLTATDMARVFTDTLFGIHARPVAPAIVRGMGDVEVGLKVSLFDSFGAGSRFEPDGFRWRQSFGATYRLGTGTLDAPDNFVDAGTGDHQRDLEFQAFTDLVHGRRFWVSLVARYNVQMADARTMRIPESPANAVAAAYRLQTVTRDLGDVLELEATPRWTLSEYVGVAAHYRMRRKARDRYTGTFTVTDLAGQQVTLDAAALGLDTEATEHRAGLGLSYSTVGAFARGAAGIPLEVSWLHLQVVRGGGSLPKVSEDQVHLRVFTRLFGR